MRKIIYYITPNHPKIELIAKAVILLVSVSISNNLMAQSAYHGGKGDGYAMSEVQNVVLGIESSSNFSHSVNLFPNPATTNQSLEILSSNTISFRIDIINILGQVVFSQNCEGDKTLVPLYLYKPGSYIVKIYSGGNYNLQKLEIAQP